MTNKQTCQDFCSYFSLYYTNLCVPITAIVTIQNLLLSELLNEIQQLLLFRQTVYYKLSNTIELLYQITWKYNRQR